MRTTVDTSQLTDEQLAALAAREGSDGPAFVALVERYQERVWRVCYRLMSNAEDASDAAQEVFVRLFLHRTKFAGRSKYSTWVHGIAVRTCLMIRRGRGRRQRRETIAGEEAVNRYDRRDEQEQGEITLDLTRMLETLDEDERALLLLKYAEGYDYEELAEMFEISVSACKMRISRARAKLKQRFPEHEFGGEEEK
jgi:RNA polymerase sigma-70 factor (ECF subfamily)